MKYLKKAFLSLLILEVTNIIFGFISVGKSIFLPYTNYNEHALYFDIDSLQGVSKLKNTKQLTCYPWGNVVFETNKLGLRDDELEEPGTLVVGNSFVEGYGINKEDRFTEILEKKLKTPFHNCGSSGVWSAIQSFILIKNLVKNEQPFLKKILFIMTPGEVANIGNRNPKNDFARNYPYKKGNSIEFYKSKNNNFKKELSNIEKLKRFLKNFFIIKCYNFFKYYGAPRVQKNEVKFNTANLEWLISKINEENLGVKVEVIVINNLCRKSLVDIEEFKNKIPSINFNIINFPDELDYYFTSNGHLNKNGNKKLASLIENIL